MENTPLSRKRELIATLSVLIIVVVIVGAITVTRKNSAGTVANNSAISSSNTADTSASSTNTASTASYKDGDYSATGTYQSPGGNEKITISVTVQNGVVTATSAQNGATDIEGRQYQNDFIGGYKSQVVGKKLSSINLSRVSGSSLTSQGFNDALDAIKSEAQV